MASIKAKPEIQTVTVAIVRNRDHGRRVQKVLGAHGIESFLTAERSFAVTRTKREERGAIKVQVRRSEVERAIKALGEKRQSEGPRPAQASEGVRLRAAPQRRENPRDLTIPAVVVVLLILGALVLFLF